MKKIIIKLLEENIEKVKDLIINEYYDSVELIKTLDDSISMNDNTKRIVNKFLRDNKIEIKNNKIKKCSFIQRRLYKRIETVGIDNYFNDNETIEILKEKLKNPIINRADKDHERYVISFSFHPRASKICQVKAHIVLWEINKKELVGENEVIMPIDGDFLNLDINNFYKTTYTEYRHEIMNGDKNPSYKHGMCKRSLTDGWTKIRKENIKDCCEICGSKIDLRLHHIINKFLFKEQSLSHFKENLLTLCNSCHGTVHGLNLNISGYIDESRYRKLIELLGSLKSQVPEHLMETLNDVEKQLGLTDNQQPSSCVTCDKIYGEGSTTIPEMEVGSK